MADLIPLLESGAWIDAIHQRPPGEPLTGGDPDLANDKGFANVATQQLGNRTAYLLGLVEGSHRAFLGVLSVPPNAPAPGDTYVVGAAPAGTWAGQVNLIAMWTGAAWAFVVPPVGILLTDPAGVNWRWDGLASSWSAWAGSASLAGPLSLASDQEAMAGTDASKAITPATLAKALGKTAGRPLFLNLSNDGSTAQLVPASVSVRCANLAVASGNIASQWNGFKFTADANSLGLYFVFNGLNLNGETAERIETWKNGVVAHKIELSSVTGTSNVIGLSNVISLDNVGDRIEFYHKHESTESKSNNGSSAQIFRLVAYPSPV